MTAHRSPSSPWAVERLDLDAYLGRIGLPARAPSRAALDELHEAHVRTFTFDNVDVLLDQHAGVELEAVQEKFVGRGRGGYCFEHAVLFAAALERLGYRVERRLGRVGAQARTHAVVAVHLDRRVLLADPGFSLSVLRPIELRDRAVDRYAGFAFRVRETRFGPVRGWELQRRRGEAWDPVHGHDELPVHPADVTAAHHYTSTFPTIHFRHRLMLTRHLADRHVTLTDDTVTVRRPGEATEHRRIGPTELPEWLHRLRVPLPPPQRAALLDRVAGLRATTPATT